MTPPDEEFDPFYLAVYPELRKYGMAWGRNGQDADDAARDVMIDIRRRWATIDPGRRAAYARVALVRAILKIRRERHAHNTSPMPFPELPLPGAGDSVELPFEGEIDVENAYEVCEAVDRALADGSFARVEIDMSRVTFIDSVGVSALVAAFQLAAVQDVKLVVTRTSRFVHRLLWTTGLLALLGSPTLAEGGREGVTGARGSETTS